MITRSLPSTRSLWSAAFLACGLFCAAAAPSADKIRIGIVMPKAQLGQGAGGADVAEPVRQTLIAYLSGPATELVPLQARIPIQANTEAQQAGCQYVLYTSVTHKKGGGGAGFGRLMGAVAPMAGMVRGLGGLGGSAGAMVASQAAAVAASAAARPSRPEEQAMAALTNASQSQIRKGDQITLEYKLQKPSEAKAAMEKTGKAKATQDGEDLLSPLIEAAATEVLTAATK